MSSTPEPHPSTCPNCGGSVMRAYCADCGQSAAAGHVPSVGHFAHDLMHEVAHVDGTILRTVKALLIAPGLLTEEYWRGRVASWVRPIRVFLVAAAIHLFFAVGIGPVNLHVRVERAANGDRNITVSSNADTAARAGYVAEDAHAQDELLEHFAHAYNAVRYLSPLLFAVASWLFYRRQQPYIVSHLILALHFYSFWYLLATVAGLLAKVHPALQGLVALSVVYLAFALRRIFSQAWWLTAIKALVLLFLLILIEGALAYSAILFAERAMGY